ncbi:MAG: DNA-processing protein DprA [Nitrosopumilus sp. B06]|nr:MAG: DNA-processing protein DprA [Nitrosopumilus sp. B06]
MAGTKHTAISIEGLLGRQLNDVEEKYAPKTVYYAGLMETPLQSPKVAVVGSRDATSEGLAEARAITEVLVENKVTLISGLAKGIDTMAHQTAIENGGKTVAVIGTPLDKTYPKENSDLQKKMIKEHLVVSQYPVGSNTLPRNFILRNRTMALIADASIIVQARENSGSLSHGWEALRLGRPLFICKSVVDDSKIKWPAKMQEYGAIKLDKYEDILEYLPLDIKVPELFDC